LARHPRWQQELLTERNLAAVERLSQWSQERGHTVGELAIAWLLAHPEVSTVIAGATKPEQVAANVAAGQWALTSGAVEEVNALL
jgi:aryl-alcohol dehydrogenase-like predicted oxidoreductase